MAKLDPCSGGGKTAMANKARAVSISILKSLASSCRRSIVVLMVLIWRTTSSVDDFKFTIVFSHQASLFKCYASMLCVHNENCRSVHQYTENALAFLGAAELVITGVHGVSDL